MSEQIETIQQQMQTINKHLPELNEEELQGVQTFLRYTINAYFGYALLARMREQRAKGRSRIKPSPRQENHKRDKKQYRRQPTPSEF